MLGELFANNCCTHTVYNTLRTDKPSRSRLAQRFVLTYYKLQGYWRHEAMACNDEHSCRIWCNLCENANADMQLIGSSQLRAGSGGISSSQLSRSCSMFLFDHQSVCPPVRFRQQRCSTCTHTLSNQQMRYASPLIAEQAFFRHSSTGSTAFSGPEFVMLDVD